MSNKTKLVLIISFFLVFVLLICIVTYKTVFSEEKTKEVVAEKTEEAKKQLDELKEEEKEVIVVILNEKKKENTPEVEESTFEQQTEENQSQENNKQTNETQTESTNNQEEQSTNHVTEPTDYYIKVNYGANVVNIYIKDTNGNFTVPYKVFTCSTGTATPTSGTYNIDYKYRWISLFGNVYGQYGIRIVGNILFHSVPYLEKGNPASLEYWEYDKLRYFCFCRMYKINCRRC